MDTMPVLMVSAGPSAVMPSSSSPRIISFRALEGEQNRYVISETLYWGCSVVVPYRGKCIGILYQRPYTGDTVW